MNGPAKRRDGSRRVFAQGASDDFDLEAPVVIPAKFSTKGHFIADSPLDPLTAIDPDRAERSLFDHPDIDLIIGSDPIEKLLRALLDEFERFGNDDRRTESMLQGISTRFRLALGGFGTSRQLSILAIGFNSSLGNDHGDLGVSIGEGCGHQLDIPKIKTANNRVFGFEVEVGWVVTQQNRAVVSRVWDDRGLVLVSTQPTGLGRPGFFERRVGLF
jgi:hypothetical protein